MAKIFIDIFIIWVSLMFSERGSVGGVHEEGKGNRKVKRVKTGYKPRKFQKWLHSMLRRFCVLVCHRRFGKTVLAVNEIIDRALRNPLRNPRYAYIAPTYKQAKKVAWQYFIDFTRFLPGVEIRRTELAIHIHRPQRRCPATGEIDPDFIEISLIGADDPDAIRGIYLDGCVLDEYAQCDPIIWGQIVRPALADRKSIAHEMGIYKDSSGKLIDPWAMFIGTPKGQNHFYRRYEHAKKAQIYCEEFEAKYDVEQQFEEWTELEQKYGIEDSTPYAEVDRITAKWSSTLRESYTQWRKYLASRSWYTVLLKASETGVLDRMEIDEMCEDMSPEEIEQELECSFTAAILGSYYGHLINRMKEEGRIREINYNPRYPVDTYWDLGRDDATSIWFVQRIDASTYHYLDYVEIKGQGIAEWKMALDAKANTVGTRTEIAPGEMVVGRGFRYGRHVWPHDGSVTEWGTGLTRQESARKMGLNVELQVRTKREDRIQATRERLKISAIDEKWCDRGIDCLYNYQREYDEKNMIFKNEPKRDWSTHGSDSYGYSSMDDRPSHFPDDIINRRGTKYGQETADTDYDELGEAS